MPPANQKPPPVRKRTRKRKRRVASSSESSSDSDSDSSANASTPKAAAKPQPIQPAEPSSDSDDSDSSSSSSSASSRPASPAGQPAASAHKERVLRPRSPSPEPIPIPIPTFLSGPDGAHDRTKETEMRERFRKLWMESVADAFQSDLQELQKEPNMTKSRLGILIDSLAAGAEVFTSRSTSANDVNEMAVVLGEE